MVSINSALEVDITGQVCADSIGPTFYSGAGGQLDFVRGAARSKGGMTFIALPSTAKNDSISRIVKQLQPGGGVVTTRYDVHHVVTEHGVASLWGRTIADRAKALINIAHPDFHDELYCYAREQNYIGKEVF
jgi:acetyl-CoA hydrolase